MTHCKNTAVCTEFNQNHKFNQNVYKVSFN